MQYTLGVDNLQASFVNGCAKQEETVCCFFITGSISYTWSIQLDLKILSALEQMKYMIESLNSYTFGYLPLQEEMIRFLGMFLEVL